eukprot:g31833.t1
MTRLELDNILEAVYGGVDPSISGNGGEECAAFLPVGQRILETIIMITVSLLQIVLAYRKIRGVQEDWTLQTSSQECEETLGRNLLQAVLCLTFGLEIGFKCATKTLIYLLNPCHVVTALQLLVMGMCKIIFIAKLRINHIAVSLESHVGQT